MITTFLSNTCMLYGEGKLIHASILKKEKDVQKGSKLSIKTLEVDELESRALCKYIWQD